MIDLTSVSAAKEHYFMKKNTNALCAQTLKYASFVSLGNIMNSMSSF